MKKKLWLLGICVVSLILIFAGNTLRLLKQENKGDEDIVREQEMMTTQNALNMLGYLGEFKDELDYLKERDKYFLYKDGLTFLEVATDKFGFNQEDLEDKLSFSLDQEGYTAMLVSEFLDFYEAILQSFQENTSLVVEKSLYLLGEDSSNTSESKLSVITNEGIYNYSNALDMAMYYENGELMIEDNTTGEDKSLGERTLRALDVHNYMDTNIKVLVRDNHIIYVKGISDEETVLHNVWVTAGKGYTLDSFLFNINKSFNSLYQLSSEITNTVCDIVLKDSKVVKISLKPDVINGKVLSGGKEYIEVEKYGKVNLDDNFKIYKIYGELAMEVTNNILVGYKNTDFVVAGGKIVAALIKEPIKEENIRVLIKTENHTDIFHDKITLTADEDYTVSAGEVVKEHKAGGVVTIKITNKLFQEGRMTIATHSGEGKITVTSLNRAGGNPTYRGTLEIVLEEDKMLLINELPLEEYLYAVIPSEMPTSYNIEALKAQAICARSYAYKQLLSNAYSKYGAHVDDSVSYQVYNNLPENDVSILAVKDTYGKVLEFNNEVITAYYFSTSCGHTSSIDQVWSSASTPTYLTGKIQTVFNIVDGETIYASAMTPETVNFSKEATFNSFITKPEFTTYDSEFAWYRWKVTLSKKDIQSVLDNNLATRYNANPSNILTLVKGEVKNNPVYESKPISTIGTVKDILVGKREDSGIISELILIGSKATIKVSTEYNIRILLAPLNSEVIRQDESPVTGLKMLPSAYFVMKKGEDKITFTGGGYGHGVGMSQNGAKAMADSGKDYETILKHYYNNVELGFIYE